MIRSYYRLIARSRTMSAAAWELSPARKSLYTLGVILVLCAGSMQLPETVLARYSALRSSSAPSMAGRDVTVGPPKGSDRDPSITANGGATAVRASGVNTTTSCTGARYTQPSAMALSSAPDGYSEIIESPDFYRIYGDTVQDLRQAITSCPLRKAAGEFHAYTSYQLSWSYTSTVTNGRCYLQKAKVGLHISQYLPTFTAGGSAPALTTTIWENYAHNLYVHEAGHVAIDREYAGKLLVALQKTPATDCAALDDHILTIADIYTTMLTAANELYDSQTDHGATQGAVL